MIATIPALWIKKLGLDFRPKSLKNSMDFQLKLTFTGRNHKDLDSQSTKSLESLFRLVSTLIRVKTAIMQSKWMKIFINTRIKARKNSKMAENWIKPVILEIFTKITSARPKLSAYSLNFSWCCNGS